jgi:hypothetical protein
MTRKEAIRQTDQENRLLDLGFTRAEAASLRRISMTLQRWFELECGNGNEYGSWAIERDENGDGPPYMVHHHYRHGNGKDTVTRTKIADREGGARRRLAAIVSARNDRALAAIPLADLKRAQRKGGTGFAPVAYYVQTDPRGAALYIIRPDDVPKGGDVSAYYSRGICVY